MNPGSPETRAVRRFLFVAAFLPLGLGACATTSSVPSSQMAGLAPMLSVERFLQAANTRDLDSMARIFGTARGPITDETGSAVGCAFKRMGSWFGIGRRCLSWREVEIRMDAIAQILQHDDYRIRGESSVAGRANTRRVGVDLTRGDQEFNDVPFVVVQASQGRWFVEQIGLDRITAPR
jgi:hypothetical protein